MRIVQQNPQNDKRAMRFAWHGKQPLAKFAPYLLPGLILLGIAIEPFPIARQPIFLNKIASSSKPGQHGGDSIQMALLDFVFDSHDISIAIVIDRGINPLLHFPKGE